MHRLRGRTNLLFLRMTKLIGMNSTPFRVLTNSSPSEVVKIVNWYVWSASSKGTSFLWAWLCLHHIYKVRGGDSTWHRSTDILEVSSLKDDSSLSCFSSQQTSTLFLKKMSRKKNVQKLLLPLNIFPPSKASQHEWKAACSLHMALDPHFFYIINPPTWMHQIASLKVPCRVCPPSPAATATNQYPLPLGQTIVEHGIGHA